MVVHARESDVLVWQMTQLIDRSVYVEAAGGDGVEEGAESVGFDGDCSCLAADS